MSLTNLTLALGLIGTSLTGSTIAISNGNQNSLNTLKSKAVVASKNTTHEFDQIE